MKIQQVQRKHGTLFIVETDFSDLYINAWLRENDIQHIFHYPRNGEYHFFLRDPASIMAFKLRWS